MVMVTVMDGDVDGDAVAVVDMAVVAAGGVTVVGRRSITIIGGVTISITPVSFENMFRTLTRQ